jgi:hypothetical protein
MTGRVGQTCADRLRDPASFTVPTRCLAPLACAMAESPDTQTVDAGLRLPMPPVGRDPILAKVRRAARSLLARFARLGPCSRRGTETRAHGPRATAARASG